MKEAVTQPTSSSVTAFLDSVEPLQKRKDCYEILELMRDVTGQKPVMWGKSIVGFGSYHYKYASGHEGDSCLVGFAPRKDKISLYVMLGLGDKKLLSSLGKHKAGVGCLYITKLEDVKKDVLRDIIAKSVSEITQRYSH
jgi:hypothetical protein